MKSPELNENLQLLLKTFPQINWDKFSLKGGTAINLFLRPLSRISVDIDLTYRTISSRDEAIQDISNEMQLLADKIRRSAIANTHLHYLHDAAHKDIASKVVVESAIAQMKIEPNLIIRGSVFNDSVLRINPQAAELLGVSKDLTATVMSFEDVYAGKICAALSRQHPRDLFDVHLLLESEGISHKTKDALMIYLSMSNRPLSELLNPNLIDMRSVLSNEFAGMSSIPFTYDSFESTRKKLINTVRESFTLDDTKFLTSFCQGNPLWHLLSPNLDISRIKSLPSIQWKLLNIAKMDEHKKSSEIKKLDAIFASAKKPKKSIPS